MATPFTITTPISHKVSEAVVKAAAITTTTGIASKYWLELVSLPAGNNNRLWLLVGGTWTNLPNTSAGLQASVQNAFNTGSNLQVAVWYDASNTIIGLVVRTP
jgi:uncharacterized SAM-dependent methyltransferase